MSNDLTRDQPPPRPNGSRPVWELVVEDMHARDRVGRERYGVPLQAGNGRDALVDAYQESLDLCVYMRQAIEEGWRGRALAAEAELARLRALAGDLLEPMSASREALLALRDAALAFSRAHGTMLPTTGQMMELAKAADAYARAAGEERRNDA